MYRKTALSLCSIRDSESDPCLSNESGLNPIDRDLVGRGILERGISDVREREELDGGSSWTIGFEEVRITRVEKGGEGGRQLCSSRWLDRVYVCWNFKLEGICVIDVITHRVITIFACPTI